MRQIAVDSRNEAFSKLQKIWWIASSTKSASKATKIIVCYINECYHIVPFDAHITDVENVKSWAIGLAVHIETMIGITFTFVRVLECMTITNNLNCSNKFFASEIDRRRRSLLLFGLVFLCFHLCLVFRVLSSVFCDCVNKISSNSNILYYFNIALFPQNSSNLHSFHGQP
jgi:hypothetical protein